MSNDTYTGDVCFKSDGWHYAVGDDGAPTDRRLVLNEQGGYRDATENDISHNQKHGKRVQTVNFE